MQLLGVGCLGLRGLLEVNVDVEAAAGAVGYRRGKLGVGGGFGGAGRVYVGFGVGSGVIFLAES